MDRYVRFNGFLLACVDRAVPHAIQFKLRKKHLHSSLNMRFQFRQNSHGL
jgi:hypothetical protein